MKNQKRVFKLIGALVLASFAIALAAQPNQFVSRAQWLKKIGAAVTDTSVMRETLDQVAPEDRVEFTQRILKAVSRMPVNPDNKAAAFVKASVACIAGAGSEKKTAVIAEIFASVPIEYLPMITEELAKRFNRDYNKLTCEQYQDIATNTLKVARSRIAETDDVSVRSTFVILTFLKGSDCSGLQQAMMELLPDDRMRGLAASWIPQVMNDNSYVALLTAADSDAVQVRHDTMLRLIGHAALDRLLADMNASLSIDERTPVIPLSSARSVGGGYWDYSILPDRVIDYGINRVPRFPTPTGYQNQRLTVDSESAEPSGPSVSWAICQ